MCGCEAMCSKCTAGMKIVGGALILGNAFLGPWKVTASADSLTNWIAFIGVLVVIKGVLKFIMPGCPHCKAEAPAKKGK